MLDPYERALQPLHAMLAADGYCMHLESNPAADNELILTVTAGPEACEECLLPAGLFTDVVRRHLAATGLHPGLTVVYPDLGTS
jgi:hypothetical protein